MYPKKKQTESVGAASIPESVCVAGEVSDVEYIFCYLCELDEYLISFIIENHLLIELI